MRQAWLPESSRAGSVKGLVDADGQVVKECEEQHHMLKHVSNGPVSPGELPAEGCKQADVEKDLSP